MVLLRLWTRLADPESWVLNASNKTVMLLAQVRYHGIEKPVPLRIKEMVEKRRDPDGFIDLDCPLVRAVAIDGW